MQDGRASPDIRARFCGPARFDPSYSILGRMLRRMVIDRKRAGAYFVVASAVLVLAMVVAQFFAWSYLEPTLSADPGGNAATAFWVAQIAAVLLLIFGMGLGRAPQVVVTLHQHHLAVRQGSRKASVALTEIAAVRRVTALQFHREYWPFADARAFICGTPPLVVVVETPRGVLGIGLPASEHKELCSALRDSVAKASGNTATVAV